MGLFEWSVEENPFYEAAILRHLKEVAILRRFKEPNVKKLDTDLHLLYT